MTWSVPMLTSNTWQEVKYLAKSGTNDHGAYFSQCCETLLALCLVSDQRTRYNSVSMSWTRSSNKVIRPQTPNLCPLSGIPSHWTICRQNRAPGLGRNKENGNAVNHRAARGGAPPCRCCWISRESSWRGSEQHISVADPSLWQARPPCLKVFLWEQAQG